MIPSLIEAALRALLVAAAVWMGLRALRVRNVMAQKAAWGLVLVSALVMPLAMRWQLLPAGMTFALPAEMGLEALARPSMATPPLARIVRQAPRIYPRQSSASLDESSVRPRELPSTSKAAPASPGRYPAPVISHSTGAAPAAANEGPPASEGKEVALWGSLLRAGPLALLLYCAVSTGLLLRLVYGLAAAARLWHSAVPVSPHTLPAPTLSRAFGLRLRASRAVSSPVTVGSGVLLPAEYTAWDAEKLRIVLAHERSHVRQGDFYLQLLAELYAALCWFSPLGWWLKRKLSDLSETISDRAGLEVAASGPSYAQVLLEFAAAPRPTLTGVAMARSNNLSRRIERLLNESSFRQAFAGGPRRALLAVLLVPVALFAATSFIRVQAAGQAAPPPAPVAPAAPAVAPAPPTPVAAAPSQPEPAPEPVVAPAQAPAPPPAPGEAPEPPPPPARREFTVIVDSPSLAPVAPEAPGQDRIVIRKEKRIVVSPGEHKGKGTSYSYSYSDSGNGDSFALVTGDRDHFVISGDGMEGREDSLEKARRAAHGNFLWFTRKGKSYIVDDPAILAQIEANYKAIEQLGRRQAELGKQQEMMGRQQEEASIPTPDLSKEMAELNKAMAKLQAKIGKKVTQEELGDLEDKLGELQGRLGELQGEMGAMQGELGGRQGKLGAEQGHIGAEQEKLEVEADRKVKSIIDQSLTNGKARPVE